MDPELAHDLAIKALKTNLIVQDKRKDELILKTQSHWAKITFILTAYI